MRFTRKLNSGRERMRLGITNGGQRGNALWGRGGRRVGAVVATVSCVLVVTAGASGSSSKPPAPPAQQSALVKALASHLKAYIPAALLTAAEQNPTQSFDVILQGSKKEKSAGFFGKAL